MGILPLRLPRDRRPQELSLRPEDIVEIDASPDAIQPRTRVNVRIRRGGVQIDGFEALIAIETNLECAILRAGGLLPLILRNTDRPLRAICTTSGAGSPMVASEPDGPHAAIYRAIGTRFVTSFRALSPRPEALIRLS